MRDFLHTPCLHPACAVRYAENSSPALHTSGTSDNCDGTDRRTLYMSRMCSDRTVLLLLAWDTVYVAFGLAFLHLRRTV